MTSPLISVIIPCYNLGVYLDEAVQSVLAQTVQNFEILIIDDGSTDEFTSTFLKSATWPHTTVFHTPNGGLARARNYLIGRSQGTFLCALDADDRLHPQFFEKTLAAFERDPGLTFVSTHLEMFGNETGLWPAASRCDLTMLLAEDTVITPALVRKDAVLHVGAYDENMPWQGDEDWDLWISLAEAGYRGVILREVLFYYRRRPGSMCEHCTAGQVRLDLIDYRIRKHRESYRAHLTDVLLLKEAQISALRRANSRVEAEIGSDLEPRLTLRQAELAVLRKKLHAARASEHVQRATTTGSDVSRQSDDSRQELIKLQAEYQRSRAEVEALRTSASWRLTRPLRSLYDVLLKRRERPSP